MSDARCPHGGPVQEDVQSVYEDDLMGIPVVLRNSVRLERCAKCGAHLSTTIPDLEGLRAAMAILRIKDPVKLNGRDVSFLRKALGDTGRAFAERLEVSPETVSRWENDREVIGPTSEKLLRLVVGDLLAEEAPAIDFDPHEIVGMRIQSARTQGDIQPLQLESVIVKMPKRPRTRYWGTPEREAA